MSALDAVILNDVGKLKTAVYSLEDKISLAKGEGYPITAGTPVNYNVDTGLAEPVGHGDIVPMLATGKMGTIIHRPYITSDGNVVSFGSDTAAQSATYQRFVRWAVSSSTESRQVSTGVSGSTTIDNANGFTVYEITTNKYLIIYAVNTSVAAFMFCEYSTSTQSIVFKPASSGTSSFSNLQRGFVAVTDDVVYAATSTNLYRIYNHPTLQAEVTSVATFSTGSAPYLIGDNNLIGGFLTKVGDSVLLLTGSSTQSSTYSKHIEVDAITGDFVSITPIASVSGGAFSCASLAYDPSSDKFIGYTYSSTPANTKLNIGSYNPINKVFTNERTVATLPSNPIFIASSDWVTYTEGCLWVRQARNNQALNQGYNKYVLDLMTGEMGRGEPTLNTHTGCTPFTIGGEMYFHYPSPSECVSYTTKANTARYAVGVAATSVSSVDRIAPIIPSCKVVKGEHTMLLGGLVGDMLPVSSKLTLQVQDAISNYKQNKLVLIQDATHPDKFNTPSLVEFSVLPTSESYTVIKITGKGEGKLVLQFPSPQTIVTRYQSASPFGLNLIGIGVSNTALDKRLWDINHPYYMTTYLYINAAIESITISMLRGGTLTMEKLPVLLGVA